jgi:chromosome segregation ATPase
MSKNIELQEEFESLISELERLKSINEITSSNSENAKNTIDEIKSFVQSVKTFKTSIESDYQTKKKDLEEIEKSLSETLNTLNDNVEKQSKKFESLANNYDKATTETLDSVKESLQDEIYDYTEEFKKLKAKLSNDFAEFSKNVLQKIDDKAGKTIQLATNNHDEVFKQFQSLNSEIVVNRNKLKSLTLIVILAVVFAVISFGFLLYKFI